MKSWLVPLLVAGGLVDDRAASLGCDNPEVLELPEAGLVELHAPTGSCLSVWTTAGAAYAHCLSARGATECVVYCAQQKLAHSGVPDPHADRVAQDLAQFLKLRATAGWGAHHDQLFLAKLGRRLEWLTSTHQLSAGAETALADVINLRATLPTKLFRGGNTPVYFGQVLVAPTFSVSVSVESRAALGGGQVDEIAGQPLRDVAEKLRSGVLPADFLMVRVGWDETTQRWYSLNNRGFTAHNIAEVEPMRVMPDIPTTEEKKRLNEYEPNRIAGMETMNFHTRGARERRAPVQLHGLPGGVQWAQWQLEVPALSREP